MTFHKYLTVVLITHKSTDKAINFIRNLSKNVKVIIIDNSNDLNLKDTIDSNHSNVQIYLIKNNGYGASINFARKKIKSQYFWVFNPDVENINDTILEKFYRISLMLEGQFSCLGPRFANIDQKSLRQSNNQKEIAEIKSISGASMYFKTLTFDKVGGFDENFFLYFEETDYCKRANQKGYKCYQINTVIVGHERGTSVKCQSYEELEELKKLYTWHFIWSKYYYYKKHYGQLLSLMYFSPTIIRILFRIITNIFSSNKKKKTKYLIRFNGLYNSVLGRSSHKRI